MTDKTNIAIVADQHINATVALCPPVVHRDDGGTYHASRTQSWLWECWKDFWGQFGRLPGRKIVILDGDAGELDAKKRSDQQITRNKSEIIDMALEVLDIAARVADGMIVIRGTQAHEGKSAWLEEVIAKDLTNIIPCSETVRSWYHFQGKIGNLRIDTAHHAPMGKLPWSRGNSANQLAARALWYYNVELRQEAPDFVFRSHNHLHADSGCNYPNTKAILLPCWSLKTEYSYRASFELTLADIGGVIVENGVDRLVQYKPKENRRVWAVQI